MYGQVCSGVMQSLAIIISLEKTYISNFFQIILPNEQKIVSVHFASLSIGRTGKEVKVTRRLLDEELVDERDENETIRVAQLVTCPEEMESLVVFVKFLSYNN